MSETNWAIDVAAYTGAPNWALPPSELSPKFWYGSGTPATPSVEGGVQAPTTRTVKPITVHIDSFISGYNGGYR